MTKYKQLITKHLNVQLCYQITKINRNDLEIRSDKVLTDKAQKHFTIHNIKKM